MNLNNSCRDLYNKDKKTSSVAKKIEAGEAITTHASMSLDTASWIITKGEGMGQRQYTNFKTVGARDGLFLAPSWKQVVQHWDTDIVPEAHYATDQYGCVNGVRYNVEQFLKNHMIQFIKAQEKLGKPLPPGVYHQELKRGGDSGRHQWFRWQDGPQPEGTKTTIALNIFDMMLLTMKNGVGTDEYSWEEPTPNSEFATRILGLLACEEHLDLIQPFVTTLQAESQALSDTGYTVTYKGFEYDFVPIFKHRNDKKMTQWMLGVQYGCLCCEVDPKDWMDEELIDAGTTVSFPMVRTLQGLKDNWAILDKGRSGKVIRRTGDFSIRKGQCLEPAAVVDMYPFTVTHKWIHFIDFDVKILIHLRLGLEDWKESKDPEQQAQLKEEMVNVQNALRPGHGLRGIAFNMATSGGSGGNTTTAQAARTVYQDPEIRSRLVDLCPQEFKAAYSRILANNYVILRLTSCNRLLDLKRVEELCKHQMLLYLKGLGDWICFTDTVHEGLAHLTEAAENNGGRGLKKWSEENLEKEHKIARRLREKKAFLGNSKSNMRDIARRMNVLSDPVVRTVQPKIICKRCLEEGHTKRSCSLAKAEANPDNISEDDIQFWSYVKAEDRPTVLQGAGSDREEDSEEDDQHGWSDDSDSE